MKRLRWSCPGMVLTVGVVLAGLFACGESAGPSQPASRIQVYLTDAPADYENVWVTLDALSVHKDGGSWTSVPLTSSSADTNGDGSDDVIVHGDGSITVDLIALRGVETLFASGVVDPGHYTQLRLKVLDAEAVQAGISIPLKVPSGAQSGEKIVGEFTVAPGDVVTLLLDFDAGRSIVSRGGSGKLPILKPVIRLMPEFADVTVSYPPGGSVATLAFEDLAPSAGDADYNDFVVNMAVEEIYDSAGGLLRVDAWFVPRALASGFHHRLDLGLGFSGGATVVVRNLAPDGTILREEVTSELDGARVVLIPDTILALPGCRPNGDPAGIHCGGPQPLVEAAVTASLTMTLDEPSMNLLGTRTIPLLPAYDPILYVHNTRQEIRLGINGGRTFQRGGESFPFGLEVPADWAWPYESIRIFGPYPNFASGDWFNQLDGSSDLYPGGGDGLPDVFDPSMFQ